MTVKKEEQTIYVFNVSDSTLLAAAAGALRSIHRFNGLSLICLSFPFLSTPFFLLSFSCFVYFKKASIGF
jgi:hypothetical protein